MKTDLDYLKGALEGINPDTRTWVTDTLEAIVDAAIGLRELDEEIEKVKEEKKSRFSKL